jgi:hypothetical protein
MLHHPCHDALIPAIGKIGLGPWDQKILLASSGPPLRRDRPPIATPIAKEFAK